jgi:hypothetical protein
MPIWNSYEFIVCHDIMGPSPHCHLVISENKSSIISIIISRSRSRRRRRSRSSSRSRGRGVGRGSGSGSGRSGSSISSPYEFFHRGGP